MKKWHIDYWASYTQTPLSFWVHWPVDQELWFQAKVFDPPLPKAVIGKGYPLLIVEVFGVELVFASPAEVTHFLAVVSQKNLPTSYQLSRQRSETYGPNRHWLSRLAAKLKPWTKRERWIPIVREALNEFEKICL